MAPEFVDLVAQRDEAGEVVQASFLRRLIELINLRNNVAHEDGSVCCTKEATRQHLRETINPTLQHVTVRVRVFEQRPLLSTDGSRP